MGMPHGDIPNLLGKVLSGTKYGVKQTRGKFGLGAKMALIWSKMSTGLPIEVWSARKGQSYISHYKLDIDIHRCACLLVVYRPASKHVKWDLPMMLPQCQVQPGCCLLCHMLASTDPQPAMGATALI